MKTLKAHYIESTAIAAFILSSGSAMAQTDEIIVTAQKREQSIQDVSIAMTAFDSEALNKLGLTSLENVTSVVPGVELFDDRGAGQPTWIIRGVGLADFNANNTPTAAIYYDEAYLVSNAMGGIGLYDVERVEVLKGPQGGLYGRNTTGGAVRIVSNRPDLQDYSGYAQASYGKWDRRGIEGAIGGPIVEDKLAFRIAASAEKGGGWQDSLTTAEDDEPGDRDFLAARGQLLFTPTPELEILFKVDIGQDKSETTLGRLAGTYDVFGDFCAPVAAGRRDDEACLGLHNVFGVPGLPSEQTEDGSTVLSNPINEIDNKWTGYNLNVDWDLGFANLVSISSYIDHDYVQFFDFDATPLVFISSAPGRPDTDANIEQWSQEFRLISSGEGPLNWIVGGVVGEDKIDTINNIIVTDLAAFGLTDGITEIETSYTQETKTASIYAQAGYDISESLNLNGSLRYTDEDKDISHINTISLGGPLFPLGPEQNLKTTLDSNWTGHIGLDWKADENVLLYAKYSRGYKSGGFFAGFSDDANTLIPYKEEVNSAFEVGLKSNPSENLQFNAAAFFYNYKDAQGFSTVLSPAAPTGVLTTVNTVGDAEHYGLELDALWTPSKIPGLSLLVSGALLDAKITDSDTQTLDQSGNFASFVGLDRNFSPKLSYSINATQEKKISDSLLGSISAVYSWRDDNVTRSSSFNDLDYGLLRQDAYGLLNLRVALANVDQGWELSLLGENVTDKAYVTGATADGGGSFLDLNGRPASWKLQARYDF